MDRVLAIAWLQFKLVLRRVQGPGGLWNMIGGLLLGILGIIFALGLALGLGFMVHRFAAGGDPDTLRTGLLIVFYLCLVLGLVFPLVRGVLQPGFDATPFVVFPIKRSRLYGVMLAASACGTDHLIYYPTLFAVTVTGVLLPGTAAVRGSAIVLLLTLFFVIWSHVIALLLTALMRTRRMREIGALVALALIIALAFAPTLFEESAGGVKIDVPRARDLLGTTMVMLSGLPPSIAAEGLAGLQAGTSGGLSTLGALLLWNAAGLWLGYQFFARQLLREGTVQVDRGHKRTGSGRLDAILSFDSRLLRSLPDGIRAVAAKDLRYLLRSVVGRFILFMAPVFTFLIGVLLRNALDEPVFGIQPERILLFGLMLYAVLFSNNFLYNAFAWEADGVKAYFLCPIRPAHVLLGKNLAVWIYNLMLFLLVMVTFSIANGPPDLLTFFSGLFLYATALLIFTGVGNTLSIRFPVPRDMSTARNQPAQVSMVASLLVLVGSGLLLGPFISLPMLLGLELLQPLLLAGLCGLAIVAYKLTLRHSAALFARRRDQLIESLKTAR